MSNSFALDNHYWSYAALSSLAKQYGGPKIFLETVKHKGRLQGRLDMLPLLIVEPLIVIGVEEFIRRKTRKNISESNEIAFIPYIPGKETD